MWLHRLRRPREGRAKRSANLPRAAQACAAEVVCLDDPAESYVQGQSFPVHALGPPKDGYRYTPRLRPWLEQNLHRFDGVVIHGLWQWHSYGSYALLRAAFLTLSFLTACWTPTSSGLSP